MPQTEIDDMRLEIVQARELAALVDLEACWENLRASTTANAAAADLRSNQKAYEDFRTQLATYNQRHTPAHVPELLLNSPSRLGRWCTRMRDLFVLLETDSRVRCPAHLVEKACRCAERIGLRMKKMRVELSPPATVQAAIQALEALNRWCDDLAGDPPVRQLP